MCACSFSVSLSSIYATHLRASHQLLCISQTHTRPDCGDRQAKKTLRALLLSCDKQTEIQIQFTKALKADFNFQESSEKSILRNFTLEMFQNKIFSETVEKEFIEMEAKSGMAKRILKTNT